MKRFATLFFPALMLTLFALIRPAAAQVVVLPSTTIAISQGVGTTSQQRIIQVRNNGILATPNVNAVTLGGVDAARFSVVSNTCLTSPISGIAGLRDCIVAVAYTPNNATADAATLTVDFASGADTVITLTGTPIVGPGVLANPNPVALGNVGVGNVSLPRLVQISNNGTSVLSITSAALATGTNFILNGNSCNGANILPGDSCVAEVACAPTATGALADNLTITSNAALTNVPLSCAGIVGPAVSLNPTTLSFGSVAVGDESAAQTVQLTNSGTTTLNVTTAALAAGTDFVVISNTCDGSAIAPGGSCLVDVACAPTASGPTVDSLDFNSDAATTPDSVALNCSGVVGPTVSLNPSSLTFGNVGVGNSSQAQVVQVTNSGITNLTVTTAALAGGTDFTVTGNTCDGAIVTPGGSCVVQVICSPTAAGALSDSLDITSDAPSGTDSVPLDCTGVVGPAVSLNPATIDFQNVGVGATSVPQTVQVTNSGTTALSVTTAALLTGTDFAITSNTCDGASVAPGGSCLVQVVCSPTATGALVDSLDITSDATSSPDSVSLACTGVVGPAVGLNPATIDFQNVGVGLSSQAQLVQVTNTGTTDLNVTTAALLTGTDFAITGNTCDGALVAPGGSCTVSLVCSPTATGALTDSLDITSDAASSPDSVSLACNGVVGPVVTVNPTSLAFGNVGVGITSESQIVQVTNSGTTTLNVTSASMAGPIDYLITSNSCDGAAIAPGGSCVVAVACLPTTTGLLSETLEIASDDPATPTFVPLTCTGIVGPAVSLNPTTLDFQDVGVGATSIPQTVQVTNNGTTPLNVTTAALLTGTDFAVTSNTCDGAAVAPGGSCVVQVVCSPTTTGALTDSLDITSDAASSPDSVSLACNGVVGPAVGLNPSSLDFQDVGVGINSQPQLVQVTNTGTTTLNVTTAALLTGTDFSVIGNTCDGAAVAPGGSCTVQVVCTPTATGALTDSLDITSDAASSPDSVSLACNGVVGPAVNLNPASLDFQDVGVGITSQAQTVQVTNSGTTTLNVTTAALLTGTDFSVIGNTCDGAAVAPGGSCVVQVVCTPTATGALTDSLDIASDATSSPDSVSLACNGVVGPAVSTNPSSLDFQDVGVGNSSAAQAVQVTNTGTTPLNISAATLATGTDFAITSSTCDGAEVAVDGSCIIQVTCSPTATGALTDSLDIASDAASSPDSVSLACNGVVGPAVSTNPVSLDFADVIVGQSSGSQAVQITNSGTTTLNITTAALATGTDFAVTSNTCNGAALVVGGSCQVQVTCSPTATGSLTDSLDITSDAASSPDSVALDCNGVQSTISSSGSGSFGNVNVGNQGGPNTITLTNGGDADLLIGSLARIGVNTNQFSIRNDECSGQTIAPGDDCSFQAVFNPSAGGSFTDVVLIPNSSSTPNFTVNLSGTGIVPVPPGVGLLQIKTDVMDFDLETGGSASQSTTVTNIGDGSVSISALSLEGDSQFSQVNDCDGQTLAPGASCTITATFSSNSAGNFNAVVTIDSNPATSAFLVLLGSSLSDDVGGGGGCSLSTGTQALSLSWMWMGLIPAFGVAVLRRRTR